MNNIYGKEATVKGSFFFFVKSIEIAVSSENRNKFGGRWRHGAFIKSIALQWVSTTYAICLTGTIDILT